MKTAIITSKSSLNHNTGSGHPESISRVTSIVETLKKNKNSLINKSSKIKKVLLELGANKDGEIGKLCSVIKPDYSLITNISNSHIGNFRSIEEYLHVNYCYRG